MPIGVLTSNLAFLAVSGLPDEDFLAYGWRIPFLISIVLVVVGLLVRVRLTDAPEFERVKQPRGGKVPSSSWSAEPSGWCSPSSPRSRRPPSATP